MAVAHAVLADVPVYICVHGGQVTSGGDNSTNTSTEGNGSVVQI